MANKKFDSIRNSYIEAISQYLHDSGEPDVLRTASNEICIPVVGDDSEEGYLVLVFKIPTGSRDGTPYNGFDERDNYEMEKRKKEEKAKVVADKKAAKIAKDQAAREAKAKAKKEREEKGE